MPPPATGARLTARHRARRIIHSSAGATVNLSNNEGLTPLMVASKNGHTAVVGLLIQARAEIVRRTPSKSLPCSKIPYLHPHRLIS